MSAKEITSGGVPQAAFLDAAEPRRLREVSPMKRKKVRRFAVALAAVTFAGAALAAGIALGDDRGTATAILNELASDTAHKAATAAIVQRGRDALERATRMRASGDEAHAQLADGLAREEAETAHDLVRALDAERMADDARRAATDAGTVGERERALLEEGIARNGRLRAELDELGKTRGAQDENKRGKLAAGAGKGSADGGSAPPTPRDVSKDATPAKSGAPDGGSR
jgi:hypothetical protein